MSRNQQNGEAFYREKYGWGFWKKVWFTPVEMTNSEEELATKFAEQHGEKFEQRTKMLPACDILRTMLLQEPVEHKQTVGGGLKTGFTTAGSMAVVSTAESSFSTYDRDTNRLFRAYAACGLGLFQMRSNPSLFCSQDSVLADQKKFTERQRQFWNERIIRCENESRKPSVFAFDPEQVFKSCIGK